MEDDVYTAPRQRAPRAKGPAAPQAPGRANTRAFPKFTLPGLEFDGDNAGPSMPAMPLPPAMDLFAGLFGKVAQGSKSGRSGQSRGQSKGSGLSSLLGQQGGGHPQPGQAATGQPGGGQQARQAPSGGPAGTSPAATRQAQQGRDDSSPLGRKALQTAKNEVGVKEEPKGSNRGPGVDRYTGGKAQAWCAHFVSWCVEQNGQSPFGHRASVAGLRNWAKNNNRYIPVGSADPAPGDIFTMARYDKTGKLVGGHTGFVESLSSSGRSVATVEGNSGDRVKEGRRPLDTLDGFIRL